MITDKTIPVGLPSLNDSQRVIAEDLLSKVEKALKSNNEEPIENRIFSIIGGSGFGKSYLTAVLIGELKQMCSKLIITATTHKALANINNMASEHKVASSTIHSYLKCKVHENYQTGTVELIQDTSKTPEAVDILFVEEASMMSQALWDILQNELFKNNVKVVIFIGDHAQLKSVDKDDENPIYCGYVPLTEYKLTEVVRQAKDSTIFKVSNYFREQIETQQFKPFSDAIQVIKDNQGEDFVVVNKIDDFYNEFVKTPFKDSAILVHKNSTVAMYNKKARLLEYGKVPNIIPMERLIFNSSHTVGDETIHYNNQEVTIKSCELVYDENNDIEYWQCITEEDTMFRVIDTSSKPEYDDRLRELAMEAKKAVGAVKTALWERYFTLKNSFQDVIPRYAYSIFKSQGSTLKYIYIDINELESLSRFLTPDELYRLLFVAISRASDKVVFFIK